MPVLSATLCKGDDWPNDPLDDLSAEYYAEPSVINYAHLFMFTSTSEITGKNVAARYMVEKLYLNRPQLILERREAQVYARLRSISQRMKEDIEMLLDRIHSNTASRVLLTEIIRSKEKIEALLMEALTVLPYRSEDVSR